MKKISITLIAICFLFTFSANAQSKKYGQKKEDNTIALIDSTVFSAESRILTEQKVFADSTSFAAEILGRVKNLESRKNELARIQNLTEEEINGLKAVYDAALGAGKYAAAKQNELRQSLQGNWTLERKQGATTVTFQVSIANGTITEVGGAKVGVLAMTGENTFNMTGWEPGAFAFTKKAGTEEFTTNGAISFTLKR